jgi:hypothetical protein
MEAFEKAKLALRQYLLENKSKVRADLEDMRSKSIGNDIYNYVVNYSNSLSFSDINVVIEPIVDANIDYGVFDFNIFYKEKGWWIFKKRKHPNS